MSPWRRLPSSRALAWLALGLAGLPSVRLHAQAPAAPEKPAITPASVAAPTRDLPPLRFPNAPATLGPAPAPAPAPLPPEPSGTPEERRRWLNARIDEILARPLLAGAKIGVAVAEVDNGRPLYGRGEHTLYNPASNAKLVTTAAALAMLGPEYRFKTALWGDALKGGEVQGNLYLKGTGDPALVSEDLWKLVADLAALGVRRVTGDLAVDDTWFDEVRVGPAFEQKDEDFAFRAPNGAVSLNYNACAIHVFPGARDGAPARVLVEPASPYFTVVNQATTTGKGKTDLTLAAREAPGHTEITVSGQVRVGAGDQMSYRRIVHPDLYTGYSLRELLRARGIRLAGGVIRAPVPPGARLLASHLSPPLGVIVRDVNKASNNFMAEQLLKTLGAEVIGRPGTWPNGVEAVSRFLATVGVTGKYQMTNGSGLYDADRFTPMQLVDLLRAAYHDFRFAADFVGSLALAGEDGTIKGRMGGGPAERYVRAKTGSLKGVSCLSGYAGAPGRMPLVFSILMNDVSDEAKGEARGAQDEIAAALVTFLQAR